MQDGQHSDADAVVAQALLETGLAVVPGYAPEATWRALGAESRRLHTQAGFRPAGVGRGASFRVQPEIRSDRVHWIDPQHPTRRQRTWLSRMEGLRHVLNERLLLGLFGFEAHLALYPVGARYRTHLDRFADASHRCVSVMLYLNDGWHPEDGGAVRLYRERPDRAPFEEVQPAGGTLVAFLSAELHHEVLPAARERWSVVGWFTTRP